MDKDIKKQNSTPLADGFSMPGEFEKHVGCIMIWPDRPGSWPHGAAKAREVFAQIIRVIAESEHVFVAAGRSCIDSARQMLGETENVTIFEMETDDAWARDVGPTFVSDAAGEVRAVNWQFNAWGGTYNGLYASWEKDDAFAAAFAERQGYALYDAAPFVLEGGSIHSDGEGTLLVTETCLLSRGRNPHLTRHQIEEMLKCWLGAQKVIWLPRGIYNDETDEHVDNVCAFVRPAEVVLAWTDRKDDPQYALSLACYEQLSKETDAKGRPFLVHKLPIPDFPICIQEKDLDGYVFEEGEDEREVGERLAASYVNFYIANEHVVMPAFGGENEQSDERAVRILQNLFPDRMVVPVMARDILLGGGNIHCITQQIPDGHK